MTWVTDEMVEAAQQATQRDGYGIMSYSEVRAALEAALAVRKPAGDVAKISNTLREWAAALDIPSGPFVNEDISEAADLIERQAEEIAALSHTLKEAGLANLQLTTERADARALLERLGAKGGSVMTAISEREENAKKKVLLLIDTALANFPGNTEIEMTTQGDDPTTRVVIPAYVLRSMLKDR